MCAAYKMYIPPRKGNFSISRIKILSKGGVKFSQQFLRENLLTNHKSVTFYYDDKKNLMAFNFIKTKSKDPHSRKLINIPNGGFSTSIKRFWQDFGIDLQSVIGSYTPNKFLMPKVGLVYYIDLNEKLGDK